MSDKKHKIPSPPAGSVAKHPATLKKQTSIPVFRGGKKKQATKSSETTVKPVKSGKVSQNSEDVSTDDFLELERQINLAGTEDLTSDCLLESLASPHSDLMVGKNVDGSRDGATTPASSVKTSHTISTTTTENSNIVSLSEVKLSLTSEGHGDSAGKHGLTATGVTYSGKSDLSEVSSQCSSLPASSTGRSATSNGSPPVAHTRKPTTEYVTTAVSDGVWYDTAKPRVSGYAAKFHEKKKSECSGVCECADCRVKRKRPGGKPASSRKSALPFEEKNVAIEGEKQSAREIAKRKAEERLAAGPEIKTSPAAKEKPLAITELKKEIDALKSVRDRELYSNRSCDVERYRDRLAQQIVAVDQKYKTALKEWKGDHSEMHNTIKALKARLIEQRKQFDQAQIDMQQEVSEIKEEKDRDAQETVAEYEDMVSALEAQKVEFQIKYEEALGELEQLRVDRAEKERKGLDEATRMRNELLAEQERLKEEHERISAEKRELEEARAAWAAIEAEKERVRDERKAIEAEKEQLSEVRRQAEIERLAHEEKVKEDSKRLEHLRDEQADIAKKEEELLKRMAEMQKVRDNEGQADHLVLEATPAMPLPHVEKKKASRKGFFTCGTLNPMNCSPGTGVLDYMPSMPGLPWRRKGEVESTSSPPKPEKREEAHDA